MALTKISKIQLIASSKYKSKILTHLQDSAVVEIISVDTNEKERLEKEESKKIQKTELKKANLEYAINVLKTYEKKKSLFDGPITLSIADAKDISLNFDSKEIVKQCKISEDKVINAKNHKASVKTQIENLKKWSKLNLKLEDIKETKKTKVKIGSIKLLNKESLNEKLNELSNLYELETISEDNSDLNFLIVFDKKLEEDIQKILAELKFNEAELPFTKKETVKELIQNLKNEYKEAKRLIKTETKALKILAKDIDKLKIAYDYFSWELEKVNTYKEMANTEYSFVLTAWVPKKKLNKLQKNLEQITKEFLIEELELEEGEVPPVVIKNSKFMTPFEAVTTTYGLPLYSELDPTPFLSIFFIIFFALCLTDAGYGLVMFATMWSARKFFKLPEGTKKLISLLMYAGIVTFFIGAIFGGWFGLTPEQVPSFLTYTNSSGELMFLFQKINAINDPLTVLILALGMGFTQILLGVIMKFVHDFRNFDKTQALKETFPWVMLLTSIGLFILNKTAIIPENYSSLVVTLVFVSLGMIIGSKILDSTTEVIKDKNKSAAGKLIGLIFKGLIGGTLKGILSLYDLVGYMSDILSYSRLLALGLATAIIGLAVNVIAALMKDMIPYFGYILMIIVFIGGHIFNLVINALGSFIHSGRLQFVEFFGKFMEGGGREFKAFSKKCKYIYIKNN